MLHEGHTSRSHLTILYTAPQPKLKILDRTLTFISLSIYPKSIHPFLNLFDNPPSVHSSRHPFNHRSVCQSICTIHPPIHPSMHSSIYSFIREAERQTVSAGGEDANKLCKLLHEPTRLSLDNNDSL